jgi:hypothetical protein
LRFPFLTISLRDFRAFFGAFSYFLIMQSVVVRSVALSVDRHRLASSSLSIDTALHVTSNCFRKSTVVLLDSSVESIESLWALYVGNLNVRNAGALEDVDPTLELRNAVAAAAGLDHLPLKSD